MTDVTEMAADSDRDRARLIAQLSLEGQTVSKGGRRKKGTDFDR